MVIHLILIYTNLDVCKVIHFKVMAHFLSDLILLSDIYVWSFNCKFSICVISCWHHYYGGWRRHGHAEGMAISSSVMTHCIACVLWGPMTLSFDLNLDMVSTRVLWTTCTALYKMNFQCHFSMGVDPYGTGGRDTSPQIFGLGGHYHECPQYLRCTHCN